MDRSSGSLRLPLGVIQPFNLSFAPDDLHVMAFLAGHPAYEAVEAMVRLRAGAPAQVRAILTRHDQSQVDHSNDRAALPSGSQDRERCFRDIACTFDDSPASRRVAVRFVSFAGEDVELDVTSLGLPEAKRGGLTDPGQHSLASSLPMMLRGRSALAAPQSRVTIGGVAVRIPVRIEAGGRPIALEGYFTESHHMAAVRAGTIDGELVSSPASFKPGERWTYRRGDELWSYDISRVFEGGEIEVTRTGSTVESIRARPSGGMIDLQEVRVQWPGDAQHFVALTFSSGTFAVNIDGQEDLLHGDFESVPKGDHDVSIALLPRSPAWAAPRPVRVELSRDARNVVTMRTTIG